MGHNDVDHSSLGKVLRAKTMGELAEIAKSCGYDLSDACLSGMLGTDPCQRNACVNYPGLKSRACERRVIMT